ncbi:MAG TPA: KpsF/GutQ family sugar-phosphate isomerase [Opitutaceae bacterium]|nr:KpsF/GutQ family sugar-phosphate isomerase [Opitutaceae bacterium]
MSPDAATVLAQARTCLATESAALTATAAALDERFVAAFRAVERTVAAGRKLILSGVGKSAHIAEKIVGTLNSIGAPSLFLDATQALHGDLGLCTEGDLAILVSNSGQTEELVRLCPLLRRFGVHLIALTAQEHSPLAEACDERLLYRVPAEACPLRLAPTASTTAALALGDAVAMVLLEARGLTREDFARFHPAGNLGLVLLLKVDDIMRTGDRLPILPQTARTQEAILAMTGAKAGSLAVVDPADGRLVGIFTDGDFRRSALTGPDFLRQPVAQFMTRAPKTIAAGTMAVEALKLFEKYKIDDLLVVDAAQRPVGLVDNQDLPKLKFY